MEYVATQERDIMDEGIRLGEEKGEKKGKREVAELMILKGFDLETIMELTGLPKKDIESLMKKSH